MGFSRQEYWGALLFPPPGDLPDSGIEPMSPVAPRHGHIYTPWFREMKVLLGGLWFGIAGVLSHCVGWLCETKVGFFIFYGTKSPPG